MKIEINSNIDWVPITFIIALLLFFVLCFSNIIAGQNQETQLKQQTIQKAIERGWTTEQVQKLR